MKRILLRGTPFKKCQSQPAGFAAPAFSPRSNTKAAQHSACSMHSQESSRPRHEKKGGSLSLSLFPFDVWREGRKGKDEDIYPW